MTTSKTMRWSAGILLAVFSSTGLGQSDNQPSPFKDGFYVVPMLSYTQPDGQRLLDDGVGYDIGVGYRFSEIFALELDGTFSELDRDNGETTDMAGLTLRGVAYLAGLLPNAFVSFGIGEMSTDEQGMTGSEYEGMHIEAGLGYVLPLSIGRYDFGIRADARFRHNNGQENDGSIEYDKSGMADSIYRVGLQLPIGLRPLPPEPEPEPLQVIEPVAICSDGIDNDGDGVQDYPGDKGCESPDDNDESGPPQCDDGIDNDADGLIDYPEDTGCEAATDNDEVNECHTPKPGERLSLNGCGPGDVIVLRGVNFEFDKSVLTPNARTILDAVAAELNAYPDVTVELAGHTDSKGAESYNQTLSEARAQAVLRYLVDRGVSPDRMTATGYGESQPVADNGTEEGRDLNRRTELTVTGN
ncbi:OmpA family protein [uncultured Abyssibacter sp.]|uniref:OmpA family protein n=1 Tax=uncultured Abyssibacter sp. TaxID=2320202 RepID=UPI0032B1CB0A